MNEIRKKKQRRRKITLVTWSIFTSFSSHAEGKETDDYVFSSSSHSSENIHRAKRTKKKIQGVFSILAVVIIFHLMAERKE